MAAMTTHFIVAELALQESPDAMRNEIETELRKRGDPLRWAVTAVKVIEQIAVVEAIVTKKAKG